MYVKPSSAVALEKGKLIDTADGFVAFWNWMAATMYNTMQQSDGSETGLKIDMTVQDRPKFKVVYV